MANFVLLIDSDGERRSRFAAAVKPRLPLLQGLASSSCTAGDLACQWAAEKRYPVSSVSSGGSCAILWGRPIRADSSERVCAERLRDLWAEPQDTIPEPFDGLYAGAVYHPEHGLTVGADLLGLFPVYYFGTPEILLVGSSPELFRYHPGFKMKLSAQGLVGILVMGYLLDGQALLEGVRRLSPGHLLRWKPGGVPREVEQYRPPAAMQYIDVPFSHHVDIIEETLERVIKRHTSPEKPCGLTLTGGFDSRLLGGFLADSGRDVTAITFGNRSDVEMQCAVPVGRALGFHHVTSEVDFEMYAEGAERHARWEHLSSGFNMIHNWNYLPALRQIPQNVVMGFALDGVLADYSRRTYDPETRRLRFESLFESINDWAIPLDLLKRLLRTKELRGLVDERLARARTLYQDSGPTDTKRMMRFCQQYRVRLHVGEAAWPLSFGCYPVLPVLDRRLIDEAAGMPVATIGGRQLEKHLLMQRFPRLADLPLDRNRPSVEVLKPRLRRQLQQYALQRLERLFGVFAGWRWGGVAERRYYYRIFDFHNAGWSAVRRLAEPYRERLFDLFDREVMKEYLPPPDEPLRLERPNSDASGRKLLLGLMLWAKEHR